MYRHYVTRIYVLCENISFSFSLRNVMFILPDISVSLCGGNDLMPALQTAVIAFVILLLSICLANHQRQFCLSYCVVRIQSLSHTVAL